MEIDHKRLKSDILALAKIGMHPEDKGLYRTAFSEADMEGKRWLMRRFEEAGLQTRMDGAGNVSGLWNHNRDQTILVGSHIDTVPCAGMFDGTLGVLTGLECLRTLKEHQAQLGYNLEIIAFSDEEGRFGGMFGSQAFCGMISPETLQNTSDLDGRTLREALESCGLNPMDAMEARRRPEDYAAYLELHVEQGPVLDSERLQIGLVESIVCLHKWVVRLHGQSNHAGTTPMHLRQDAFMGLADFAHEIPRILEENGSPNSRATIGKAQILPGSPNTVPGLVEFSLDVRDGSDELVESILEAASKALSAICRRRNLRFDYEIQSQIPSVPCSEDLLDKMEQGCREMHLKFRRMISGAAHDAQIVAHFCPVAMIFVPSRKGQSHSPAEWTSWNDIRTGANLMLHTLNALKKN